MQRHVLIDGPARRHPFRTHATRVAAEQRKVREDSDLKLFALSFSAFFVCFATFIF